MSEEQDLSVLHSDDLSIDDEYEPDECHPTKYVLMALTTYPVRNELHFMPLYRLKYLECSSYDPHPYNRHMGEVFYHPVIGECFYMTDDGEYVSQEDAMRLPVYMLAVVKMFWWKVIQRTWKRVMAERKRILNRRCQYDAIQHRVIYGQWPNDCHYLPSLRGLLVGACGVKV